MAITRETGLNLDSDRLIKRAVAILPNRTEYFVDLVNQFKKRYPTLKLIYANCTCGEKVDPMHPAPDFVLIFSGQLVSNDPKKRPIPVIMLDAPMIFTDRSIAGWTLSVEANNIDGYFRYMMDKALRIEKKKFAEYIVHMALLSVDPQSPHYWKLPENSEKLISELSELYARYAQRGSTRMQDLKGYHS